MAVVTFEMFRLLMRDEDLQVIEVTLAIIAPGTIQELRERRTTSFLAHLDMIVEQK
jgi:hypothetical protein